MEIAQRIDSALQKPIAVVWTSTTSVLGESPADVFDRVLISYRLARVFVFDPVYSAADEDFGFGGYIDPRILKNISNLKPNDKLTVAGQEFEVDPGSDESITYLIGHKGLSVYVYRKGGEQFLGSPVVSVDPLKLWWEEFGAGGFARSEFDDAALELAERHRLDLELCGS